MLLPGTRKKKDSSSMYLFAPKGEKKENERQFGTYALLTLKTGLVKALH